MAGGPPHPEHPSPTPHLNPISQHQELPSSYESACFHHPDAIGPTGSLPGESGVTANGCAVSRYESIFALGAICYAVKLC
jgi:hypothetical protein